MVLYRLGIVSTSCNLQFATHISKKPGKVKHLLDHGNMAFRGDSCPVHVPSIILELGKMAELRKVDEEAYMYTFTVEYYLASCVVEEFDSITGLHVLSGYLIR